MSGSRLGRRLGFVTLLSFQLLLACNDDSVRPDFAKSDVAMTLELSTFAASPGEVVEAVAVTTNIGASTVQHADGCSFIDGMTVHVLCPDGSTFDNGLPEPLLSGCPDYCCVEMKPGETRRATYQFDGKIYRSPSGEFDYALPGDYTIVVRFGAWTPTGAAFAVQREASFQWDKR